MPNNIEKLSKKLNEDKNFGEVSIYVEGYGFIRNEMVKEIKKSLRKFMGERHLYVDNEEINT